MTHELRTRQAWRRQFLERCQTLFCRTWKVSPVWVRHALSAVRRGDRVLGFPCAFTLFHAMRECLKPLLGAGFRLVAGPRLCAQHRDGGNACRGTQGCPAGQPSGAKCLLQNTHCVLSGGGIRASAKSQVTGSMSDRWSEGTSAHAQASCSAQQISTDKVTLANHAHVRSRG